MSVELANAHVEQYFLFMTWLAKKMHRPMAQAHYFTCYQLEKDPSWSPYF